MIRFGFGFLLIQSILVLAAEPSNLVATITQLDGKVTVYTNPSSRAEGPTPRALYRGQYFTVTTAEIGRRVENGNFVRTAPGGRARLIFENGDTFTIGPSSTFKIQWKKADVSSTLAEISEGTFRGSVSKDGPRNRLKLRTASATMGVRGTDFFLASDPVHKLSRLWVMRGKVDIKADGAKKLSQTIEKGFRGEAKPEKSIQIDPATKQELLTVQKITVFKKPVAPGTENLEKAAVEATLKDIKASDPSLFDKISKLPATRVDTLNTHVVKTLFTGAPDDTKGEPSSPLGDALYDQFFETED